MSILGIDWAAYDKGVADSLNGEPEGREYGRNSFYTEGYDGARPRRDTRPDPRAEDYERDMAEIAAGKAGEKP
jgi:hypothetical protein